MTNPGTIETPPVVRVGVIGAGWPGERHADGYVVAPGCRLVAIADANAERATAFAAHYGKLQEGLTLKIYADYPALLADPEIDAVSVALPNFLHHPATLAALEAGKHVLCEKPPALNASQAREMAELAARTDRLLAFAFQRRFSPAVEALHEVIASGELGEIYHARAVWTRAWGVPKGIGGWFTDPARAGGGALIDIGVHVLDMAWFLMGCPAPATVSGQVFNKFPQETKTDDSAFALVRFADGRSLHLETSWVLAQDEDHYGVHLYGTKGGARVDDNRIDLYTVGEEGRTARSRFIRAGWQQAFLKQSANFVGAVRGEAQLRTPAAHGVQIMAMIDGIYRSAAEGHEVVM
ncbi:MAG TPA: Gfo/Idh/MocA family oxidoreductase [Roseiflexaceae bacterium]|nr:Gfo/Idh/MocA family oxidoreductase [Roseiflexaceae bacterium]